MAHVVVGAGDELHDGTQGEAVAHVAAAAGGDERCGGTTAVVPAAGGDERCVGMQGRRLTAVNARATNSSSRPLAMSVGLTE